MRRIDDAMSTYKPTSELSRVNARAAQAPVKISPELFDLFKTALDYSRITDGAFDITYASVGYLYDFRQHVRPGEEQIKAALPGVNYRHVVLDRAQHTVRFTQPGVRIDLGGIAKGHAVDRGIAILQGRGIQHALVTAGGDSRIIGDRFGKPWVVGIRHPDRKEEVIARIPLEDAAISTSGDYERYFDEDGVRYHHIIDPEHRPLGEQGAQRDDHRADGDAHGRPVEDRVRARPGARAGDLQPPRRHRCDPRDARRPRAVQQGPGSTTKIMHLRTVLLLALLAIVAGGALLFHQRQDVAAAPDQAHHARVEDDAAILAPFVPRLGRMADAFYTDLGIDRASGHEQRRPQSSIETSGQRDVRARADRPGGAGRRAADRSQSALGSKRGSKSATRSKAP